MAALVVQNPLTSRSHVPVGSNNLLGGDGIVSLDNFESVKFKGSILIINITKSNSIFNWYVRANLEKNSKPKIITLRANPKAKSTNIGVWK